MQRKPAAPLIIFFFLLFCFLAVSFASTQTFRNTAWNAATRFNAETFWNSVACLGAVVFVLWLFITVGPVISQDISNVAQAMEDSMKYTYEKRVSPVTQLPITPRPHRVYEDDNEAFRVFQRFMQGVNIYREWNGSSYTLVYEREDKRGSTLRHVYKAGTHKITDSGSGKVVFSGGDADSAARYIYEWKKRKM